MYLLDANVFIQATNLHYGFDFCPAFWDWIDQAHGASTVTSITAVADELRAGRDDLATWAEARPDFFRGPDSADVASLQAVSAWASGAGYDLAAINTFLQLADFYLVAHALAHGMTVVTHEIAANSAKRIKIPNACIGVGIRWTTPYTMLRALGARFVLGDTR